MNTKSLRYIVISVLALFLSVGAANAVGVFYYDAATNQFVLDGNLKISDPGSFKLFLRELNSTDDSHLYINGRKDAQIRIDADNTDSNSKFKVNNGQNQEVFTVDENAIINAGRTTTFGTAASQSNTTINGTLTATGAVSANGNVTIGGALSTKNVSVGGTLSATGQITGAGLSSTGGLTMNGSLVMPYGKEVYWTGVSGTISNATFGHYTTATQLYGGKGAFVWNVAGENKMVLGDNGTLRIVGDLVVNGSITSSSGASTSSCSVSLDTANGDYNSGSNGSEVTCASGMVMYKVQPTASTNIGIWCAPLVITCQ